ncbi:MAG: glycine zipper family protein [Deltaproteobacteria bacterium]|nr:glycine zipper family protein [Deltaproteobacteria bacterium]
MADFLTLITSFPTVVYSVGLCAALIYWLFVIVGAADIELLDGDAAAHAIGHGAGEAAAHGAAHALGDGIAEAAAHSSQAALEGGGDAGVDAVAHGHAEAGGTHLPGLLHALRLRQAPVTVVLSFIFLFGFIVSSLATSALPSFPGILDLVLDVAVFLGAFVAAVPLTSLAVRPFSGLFVVAEAVGKATLVGRTCLITSSRVDAKFGQAEVAPDAGAGVLVDVRSDKPNKLAKGDEALLVDYDPARDVFLVEPLDLASELQSARSTHSNRSAQLTGSVKQEN